MPTIAEFLGIKPSQITFKDHPALPPVAAYGFEVELENAKAWPSVAGWVKKEDGSLRAGKEYIFDGPQSGEDAINSLDAFDAAMKKAQPDPTFRCSTHCHMDIRDLGWVEYERTVLAFMVYEDVFFDHCERTRRNSNFCIPFYKNDWLSAAFGRRILAQTSDRNKWQGTANWPKYSALNLQVTSSFGSIEFRGSHAMVDKLEMLRLAQRLMHIKRIAKEVKATDHYDFVKKIAALGSAKVFTTGVAKDYIMEEGALEQGISTAMHALLTSELEKLGRNTPNIPRQERANDGVDANIRMILGTVVQFNAAALLAVNVAAPHGRPTYTDAIRLVEALNKLNGVDVALSGMVTDINPAYTRYLANHADATRRRLGFTPSNRTLR